MATTVIPEASTNRSADLDGQHAQPLPVHPTDSAAARRVIRQANKAYLSGMSFVWSGVTCAYLPFMLPFSDNATYVALAAGAVLSLVGATCMAVRLRTIVSQGQDRENLFCRSIYSYERQLRKANSRADEAERQSAILMRIDRRLRGEGEADGAGGTEYSPFASRFRKLPKIRRIPLKGEAH